MKTLADYFDKDNDLINPIPSSPEYYLFGYIPVKVNSLGSGCLIKLVGVSENGVPFNVEARANYIYLERLDEYV